MVSASTPVAAPTRSGLKGSANAMASSSPITLSFRCGVSEIAPVLDQGPEHREQQQRVGARTDRYPRRRARCRLGAPRVDHDDLASTTTDGGQTSHDVRGRKAWNPAKRQGSPPQDHQVVSPAEIGNRCVPHPAEQQGTHHVERPLVYRSRRIVGRHTGGPPGHADECADVGGEAEVVRHRVADVDSQYASAVFCENRAEDALHLLVGFWPVDLAERSVRRPHHGLSQAVRIVVQMTERRTLRADVPARPHVLGVSANVDGGALLYPDPQTAHGLAQGGTGQRVFGRSHDILTGHLSRLAVKRWCNGRFEETSSPVRTRRDPSPPRRPSPAAPRRR